MRRVAAAPPSVLFQKFAAFEDLCRPLAAFRSRRRRVNYASVARLSSDLQSPSRCNANFWNRTLGSEAFVWNPVNGMRNLRLLLTEYGVDMTGWRLDYATSVSAEGSTI